MNLMTRLLASLFCVLCHNAMVCVFSPQHQPVQVPPLPQMLEQLPQMELSKPAAPWNPILMKKLDLSQSAAAYNPLLMPNVMEYLPQLATARNPPQIISHQS